jgi:CubicO group peptidase (beta-lactamase class C family)
MQKNTPETVGFSSQRLERIIICMQRYIDEKMLAGIVTLVARRGQVAYFERFGWAEIESGRPMALDTIFRIYSMTKPVTCVALLMLMEEGRLRLSDPVSHYIPAFREVKVLEDITNPQSRRVDVERQITIRDLMTHTAGLSYGDEYIFLDDLYREQVWEVQRSRPNMTLKELVEAIAGLPLAFQPGTRFRYSAANEVLGYLVQVISGMPFNEFLKQRIFDPLGMPDTDFWVPPQKLNRFCATYGPGDSVDLKVVDPLQSRRYSQPTPCPKGGSGLVSTAGDYLRFAQMLLNHGELDGTRLLGRKTVELMTMNHLPAGIHPFGMTYRGYGLGVSMVLDVAQSQLPGSVGNYGWSGAAGTYFWVDPREELIGILMIQFKPDYLYPISDDLRILTYQAMID